MRTIATVLATCAALGLAVPPAASAPAFSSSCDGGPLFGVVRSGDGRALARIERRTLRPRSAGQVPLPDGVYGWSWDLSPSCDAAALAGVRGRIVLVDLERGRRTGTVRAGGGSPVTQIAWARPDRLVALAGPYWSPRLDAISIPDGRVIASHRLAGRVQLAEASAHGLAVLTARHDRIGTATLWLASPDGGLLRVPLRQLRAGYDPGDRSGIMGRQIVPGLAVDEAGGRAYVLAANEPLVAEVDLASGAVSYRELSGGRGPAAPPMAAKGLVYGAFRTARWVGDGTIAVSGEVTRTRRDWRRAQRRGEPIDRLDPHGLRLIRVADWTVTTLNPLLRWFGWAGDTLFGMDSIPVPPADSRSTGLVAYGTDGRRRFTRFRGDRRASIWGAAWPYAYVRAHAPKRTVVVDLRSGRTVNETGPKRPLSLLVR